MSRDDEDKSVDRKLSSSNEVFSNPSQTRRDGYVRVDICISKSNAIMSMVYEQCGFKSNEMLVVARFPSLGNRIAL
jgi:hypothetical protein